MSNHGQKTSWGPILSRYPRTTSSSSIYPNWFNSKKKWLSCLAHAPIATPLFTDERVLYFLTELTENYSYVQCDSSEVDTEGFSLTQVYVLSVISHAYDKICNTKMSQICTC
jgi:hypothetical protein